MRLILLTLVTATLAAQSSNSFNISPRSAAATGELSWSDLTGNKLILKAPNAVTAYTLTWPGTISAGCLTSNGSGVLTWQSCVSLPIDDTNALIRGSADATKLIRFEVDGLTTATTRVMTVPDQNQILAGRNVDNQFSVDQTVNGKLSANNLDVLSQSSITRIRTLEINDLLSGGGWYQHRANVSVSNSNYLLRDNGPSRVFYVERQFLGSPRNATQWFTDFIPARRQISGGDIVDDTQNPRIGRSTDRWLEGWFGLVDASTAAFTTASITGTLTISNVQGVFPGTGSIGSAGNPIGTGVFSNLTVTGTCTGCGSIPDASPFARGAVSTGTQTFGGDKSFQGSVLPAFDGSYSNGTTSLRWLESNALTGRFNSVIGGSGSFAAGLSVNGTLTIATVQGIFPGTGFIGTIASPIGDGVFTNLRTSAFGSSNIFIGGGNFYNRTFAGSPSCAGLADGWTGVDTFNLRLWVCIGGTARWATLN